MPHIFTFDTWLHVTALEQLSAVHSLGRLGMGPIIGFQLNRN